MNYPEIINNCEYTFLIELSEIESNTLKIVIQQAIVSESKSELQIGDHIIKDLSAIEINDSCKKFEFIFNKYVGYSVRNESYSWSDENERYEGGHYRIYQSSQYINFIGKATNKLYELQDEILVHYGIYCGDHIIDIASTHEPEIRML